MVIQFQMVNSDLKQNILRRKDKYTYQFAFVYLLTYNNSNNKYQLI